MREKVLVVGSGGREHALVWKLAKSSRNPEIYAAPGNGGTGKIARNIAIKATDVDGLFDFARREEIDLTIVGSEDALALGIVDLFQAFGLRIFGPTRLAAEIESSKAFAKKLTGIFAIPGGDIKPIPTASFQVFDDCEKPLLNYQKALAYVRSLGAPIVVKASGLALGKGAYVCQTIGEAEEALCNIMVKRVHGDAGNEVVVEEFLGGMEISIHAFCDGKTFKLFPSAQDHKRASFGDQGPNTGGMGAIAPVPWVSEIRMKEIAEDIVGPALEKLAFLARPFVGCLYPGLMMTPSGPKLLEFNARPGDPETQSYLRLLKTDLYDILEACAECTLDKCEIEWDTGSAVTIVLASGGYPGTYKKGLPISGIEEAEKIPGVVVFHAGTTVLDGKLVTSGGRVLGVSALGKDLTGALQKAYQAVDCINFDGMQFRSDIGQKSLTRHRAMVAIERGGPCHG